MSKQQAGSEKDVYKGGVNVVVDVISMWVLQYCFNTPKTALGRRLSYLYRVRNTCVCVCLVCVC